MNESSAFQLFLMGKFTLIYECLDYEHVSRTDYARNPRFYCIHVRGHAERLSDNLGHFFNLTGYVKPNADLKIITTTAKSESKNMSKYDVIILCDGAKNIGKNETYKKLCCISQ